MGLLSGKNVIVTGALRPIGRAMVSRYRQEGSNVIALKLPGKKDAAASLFQAAKQTVRYFGCDLEDLAATETSAEAFADEVSEIDIHVNNAVFPIRKPHEQFSIAEYEKQIRINVNGLGHVLSGATWNQRSLAMDLKET